MCILIGGEPSTRLFSMVGYMPEGDMYENHFIR